MKATFTIQWITILFSLIFHLTLEGSTDKIYDGYIITTEKDTLNGKIEMLSPTLNEVKVKLIDNTGKVKKFKAKDVEEYGFDVKRWNHITRTYYFSRVVYIKKKVEQSAVTFGAKNILLEREITGAINLYHHFIARPVNVDEPYWHYLYVEKHNSGLIQINKTNYREIIEKMTIEYTGLKDEVENYKFSNLVKILDIYNKWMLENQEETVLSAIND